MDINFDCVNDVATSKAKLMVYLDPEVKDDLEKLSQVENRTMSNYVETLIREAIAKAKTDGVIK